MAKYSTGRFALRISDRDGQAYPYNEMVQEWTGSWVHISEYEPKSPLLDPRYHPTDPQSLSHAKPQIADSTVYVGDGGIRKSNGQTVQKGVFDGVGVGDAVNTFQTLEEPVTLYRANGVAYAGFHRSMMPLSVQQPMKTTRLLSRTGHVTVTTT